MKTGCLIAAMAVALPLTARSSLVPTAPADYATVPLLSSGMKAWKAKTFAEQKSASATKETTARYNTEKDYAANSLPVRISWSGGAAPYAVRVVRSHGGGVFYEGTVSDAYVDLMNLEVGRNYTWTVTSGSDKAEGHFFTEPDAPRAINKAECVISNVRDIGGWMTEEGKVVKQGMVYRSESFDYYTPTNPDADPTNPNHDEWTAEVTPIFQRFWNDKASIRTEIDLREKGDLDDAREEYGFADSVISNAHVIISEDICGITFNEACYYNAFTTANGKKAMLSIITNFANSASYPFLFHCRYGKDRTGTLALILGALLGVPEDSLRDDYAFTYYAVAEHKANSNFDSVSTMFTRLNAYSGGTLKDKTAAYLLDIGVTQTQIDAIRANLLEEPESPDEKLDEFAYKNYYFRRSAWGGSWNSDTVYWYKTRTGTTKAFKSTDDPCYPKGADAAVWFYPYGSQNKYAFPVGIGQAATPAPLGRIVTDNTYGSPDSEIGFNSLNAVFSNAGHSVNDRAFWEHVNGIGMADVVRFFFDGAANNAYSLTMHPNTEMIFQFLTCYGTTSGALYTSNLSTSSTHANFKSSPAYLKFLPGGDQTVRVTEDGDSHLYSKIGWFMGGDPNATQTFVFENAFLELTNDNHDNAVLGKLSFDFRLGDYVKTTTALAMLRARGALAINPGSTLRVDAGQKAVGKYKLISSVKSLTCDDSFYTAAEISNLAAGTSATVTRTDNTLYLTVVQTESSVDDWDGLAVDYGREVGRIRPELHSAGYLPSMWKLGELDWSDDLRALNLYGMRTHDLALQNGALRVCDVWNIFPLLHRDATDPKAYYFKPTDDLLAFAQTNLGFKVFFRLGTSIEHTKDKFFNTTVETKDYAKLADVFCGIVQHYTAGWADGFTWDIPYWEIWNEPDLGNRCWGGTRDQFAEFFATVLKKLKTEFPNLKIGGPAMTSFGASQQEWFAAIFSACQKKGILPDFISYHRYTTSMSVLINEIKTARQWLDDRGYGTIELILNEWHYDLGNNEAKSGPFTVTALAQFQYLPLDQAYFYGCNYAGSYGIVNNSTNEKLPSYYALKLFGEVVRDYTWLCKGGGLADGTVLAALSDDRTKGCLIVSEPKSTKPVVRLRGIEGLSNVRCRIFDGTGDLAPATADWSPGEQTLTLTRHSVAMSFLVTFDVQLKGGAK